MSNSANDKERDTAINHNEKSWNYNTGLSCCGAVRAAENVFSLYPINGNIKHVQAGTKTKGWSVTLGLMLENTGTEKHMKHVVWLIRLINYCKAIVKMYRHL